MDLKQAREQVKQQALQDASRVLRNKQSENQKTQTAPKYDPGELR